MSHPTLVVLVNQCFHDEKCAKKSTTPQNLRAHLKTAHHFVLPNQIRRMRRYNNNSFCYLRNASKDECVKIHFACPCCVAHFEALI
ncbi:uncharacterized protein BYT42DRAFT_494608 [Radiomyces spectabilis]|uniref:uncharacterized protein n=1 Tax=Radiomyces spectabilis TaxID=64574 RepID=UPI00221F861E|nr:uncharacterized protein BYT42DRAFT_494608 [Radiomyces spectabilis]KAI8381488.1 hypothetical protein BYT42DRAFT_494608 [Radiomyces spectabilis]